MEFQDYTIRLGIVILNNDPQKLGRVKCSIPDYWDPATMDKDKALPWVYRWPMCGYQQFSLMMQNSKVWVLSSKTNPYEHWYIPYPELNPNTKELLNNYKDCDILISRYADESNAQLFYTKDEGFKTILGENYMHLKANGDIEHLSNGTVSKIEGKIYYCGEQDGEWEPMVLGDKLNDLCGTFSQDLAQLIAAANGSPYTTHLAAPLQKMKKNWDEKYPKLRSQICKLN